MTAHGTILAASLVAALASMASFAPAGAGSKPDLSPTMSGQAASTSMSQLRCPDPAPVSIGSNAFGLVGVNLDPATLEFSGIAENLGSAVFVPGAQPEKLQLWSQWTGEAPTLMKEVLLGAMPVGGSQAVRAKTNRQAYVDKMAATGAPPHLTLKVVTSSTKDCKRGAANEYSVAGPTIVLIPGSPWNAD